ncbi:hypothetical protein EIK77_001175 [Talaromyces pinophilus]|nr:hypothetical protein EIK77_001175 [Talaromyces pinophilus]
MADDHRPVSATPTLNNEDINHTTTIQHESRKMNAESASLDTTTTMERNHDIEKEHEKETGRTFNHDTEDEEGNPQKVNDATASQADLTRTTSTVQYVEGMKLYVLMASMTLIFFLVMIDITIVSTVS